MADTIEVRSGQYHESVRLMHVSSAALDVPGVHAALVAMATSLNLELLSGMDFDPDEVSAAEPNDLVIAIRADTADDLQVARALVDDLLAHQPAPAVAEGTAPSARTIESAARAIEADLALVSVPGPHAFVEAMAALRADLHVMVFSNNVPVEQEILLKAQAARRGLLVMGPDCGTAIVNGVGLGFANVVQPGPVALTGASGTGIQQLCCLLDAAGVGVRHALGSGSRDLSIEVGAASTLSALDALDADPSVEVIVVVSKPPAATVASRVREAAAACATPVVLALLGEAGTTIESAAREALGHLGKTAGAAPSWPAPTTLPWRGGVLRGFFSGGTLRDEAASILAGGSAPPEFQLIDLGADEYTQGRPHPMIDNRLRLEELDRWVHDSSTGLVLLDVVLGHGSHPDPASELVPAVRDATDQGITTVVSLCGTRDDPQGLDAQATAFQQAGASVWLSNAAAARHAGALAEGVAS